MIAQFHLDAMQAGFMHIYISINRMHLQFTYFKHWKLSKSIKTNLDQFRSISANSNKSLRKCQWNLHKAIQLNLFYSWNIYSFECLKADLYEPMKSEMVLMKFYLRFNHKMQFNLAQISNTYIHNAISIDDALSLSLSLQIYEWQNRRFDQRRLDSILIWCLSCGLIIS